MASPRLCCAGETEVGNREAACAVEGNTTRAEREETALGDGACRESIVRGGCAQLSDCWGGNSLLGVGIEIFGRGL